MGLKSDVLPYAKCRSYISQGHETCNLVVVMSEFTIQVLIVCQITAWVKRASFVKDCKSVAGTGRWVNGRRRNVDLSPTSVCLGWLSFRFPRCPDSAVVEY